MNDDWPISSTARRNAACRAACEGIPTEALEAGVVKDMLEALQMALPYVRNDNTSSVMRAAIAKATEAKQ